MLRTRRRRLRRARRVPRLKGLALGKLIPNIITVSAACSGLTGIRFAIEARWELDIDLVGVIEDPHRPPWRIVAADRIAEAQIVDIEPTVDDAVGGFFGCDVTARERQKLIARIMPGNRGHIGLGRAGELQVIGAPVSDDDEVGAQALGDGFDQHVRLCRRAGTADRIADHPADGVAGRDGDDLLTRLERDVADVPGRRIELVECAFRIGIDLDRVDIAVPAWLHRSGGVGVRDALFRRPRVLRGRLPFPRHWHQLTRQGQRLRHGDDLDGSRRLGSERRGIEVFRVVTYLGRQLLCGAGGEQ